MSGADVAIAVLGGSRVRFGRAFASPIGVVCPRSTTRGLSYPLPNGPACGSKIAGWQEAEATAREVRAREGAPPPAEAFRRAMELWELRPELFDRPRTEAELEGIDAVRLSWQRLRERWRG